MEFIDRIEARAAARAIHRTVRMIEKTFDVKAKGSTAEGKAAVRDPGAEKEDPEAA